MENKGYTWDPSKNDMLRYVLNQRNPESSSEKENVEGNRSDRIIYISKECFWDTLSSVKLFGNEQISFFENLYPSTHFGVNAVIESSKIPDSGACFLM